MTRDQAIATILADFSTPCPEIVEVFHLRDTITGRTYSQFAMRSGVPRERCVRVSVGFAYVDRASGTTYGTRAKSPDALRRRHDERQAADSAAFAEILRGWTDEQLASQAVYCLG